MPRVHHVKKARKDHDDCGVKIGESYFWWKIKTGPASGIEKCSREYPKQSQLTNSPFYQSAYSVIEDINSVSSVADSAELQSLLDGWIEDIQQIADECEESYNNMPDNLRDTSETGAMLQERKERLEEWIAELQSTDVDDDTALADIQGIGNNYV